MSQHEAESGQSVASASQDDRLLEPEVGQRSTVISSAGVFASQSDSDLDLAVEECFDAWELLLQDEPVKFDF